MPYKKLGISILITAIFISGVYSARATDWFYAVKEMGLDTAARAIASSLLRSMTGKLIQKIQSSGEGGRPSFVQNWTNFLTDNQYKGEDAFRAILASTTLCGYLDQNIKDLFGVKPTQIKPPFGQNVRVGSFEPFKLRANCTMPSNFNMANYQRDFAGNGGWTAWSRMLEPQNNYYGLLLGSLDESTRQRDLYERAAHGEVQAGSGYTSIRGACQDQLAGTGGIGPTQPSQARCTFMGKIFTPADLLGKTAATTIDKDMEGILNSDELMETLIAIGSALVNRLGNLAEDQFSGSTAPDNADPNDIRSQQALDGKSYREEYCSASKPSLGAIFFVKTNNPITFTDFPIGYSGGSWSSYCDQFRDKNNAYPYQRCIGACFKSLEIIPENIPSFSKPTPLPEPPEETCEVMDGGLNHTDVVASVINELTAAGKTFSTSCDQFEITKRVAWQLRGEGGGLQRKTSGNNCQGYSVDIIAYPDGTTYDMVSSAFGPQWNASCLIDPTSQYAPAFDPGPIGGGAPPSSSGSLRGTFASGTGTVLDYTTSGLCVDANGSGAIIRRDGADIYLITSNDPDLPAGTRIDPSPPSGNHTYGLYDAGCGDPSKQVQLGTVSITVP